jgi:hypothetical protein
MMARSLEWAIRNLDSSLPRAIDVTLDIPIGPLRSQLLEMG